MRGAFFVARFPVAQSFLLRVEDSIFMKSTGAQPESGDTRASNDGGGSRASQRSGTKIWMCTSSATLLDPAEKDTCDFCKRTGLSKNKCPTSSRPQNAPSAVILSTTVAKAANGPA